MSSSLLYVESMHMKRKIHSKGVMKVTYGLFVQRDCALLSRCCCFCSGCSLLAATPFVFSGVSYVANGYRNIS